MKSRFEQIEEPMKSLEDYTTVICPDDNNTYVAYVPAIEGFE